MIGNGGYEIQRAIAETRTAALIPMLRRVRAGMPNVVAQISLAEFSPLAVDQNMLIVVWLAPHPV